MDDESKVLEKIRQYQNSIVKHYENGNDDKILYYIKKLYDMPVTVQHLKETGIGRTMNSLRKYSGNVGIASKTIVSKWKNMVAIEEAKDEAPECPMREPSPSPPPTPEEKHKSREKKEEKHSKHNESKEKHRKHSSEKSDRSSSKSSDRHKSHKKEEKNSHKSSHRDKEHKKHSDKHKKEKPEKRKHEEDRSPSKKPKYDDSDSEDSNRLTVDNLSVCSDDILPDSTTHDSGENNSPPEKKEKKKSDVNGSSKKSSQKEKKSSKESKSTTKTHKSKKLLMETDNGIDSGSGASFAEALGMIEPPKKSFKSRKSSSSPVPSTSSVKPVKSNNKPTVESPLTQNLNLLSPLAKLEPLDTTIVSQLPEITTNYKPLGINYDTHLSNTKHHMTEEEALSVVISSKTQRTKVYSGVKTNWGFVPSLFQLCVRILQDNIDALEYTGGVPYEILKPVLERATATQLLKAEYYNPYLIEESDELWELHCRKECKGMKRQELESWREMYMRCKDEREAKLKALAVNIKQSIDKSLPVRQTKLAYVDSVVKPPRGIARKQAKYGTSENMRKPLITPSQRLNSIASGSGEKISVPNPAPRSISSSSAAVKPKKAPLMQKTLALMKGRFGRR